MGSPGTLDHEHEMLHGLGDGTDGVTSSRIAIWVEDLTKRYRRSPWQKPVVALDGLNLRVEAGEIFGFLGPNGAGKTTTTKLLTGLILPTRGRVLVTGAPANSRRARSRVGFLPENPSFTGSWTTGEFLELSAHLTGMRSGPVKREIGRLVERLGLESVRDRRMSGLSKGQLQLAGIAQALIGSPPVLILDEPMSGLDPVGRSVVRDVLLDLRARGRTVFLSSHILSDVEMLCDRVGLLGEGRLEAVRTMNEVQALGSTDRELVVQGADPTLLASLVPEAQLIRTIGDQTVLRFREAGPLNDVIGRVLETGAEIVSLTHRGGSLEQFVLDRMRSGGPEIAGTIYPVVSDRSGSTERLRQAGGGR